MIHYVSGTVEKDMIGLIICSHGSVSRGLAEAVSMVYGSCSNLAYLGLEESDDIESWGNELADLTRIFPKGCIVLVDLFGGTPCNQFLAKTASDSSSKTCAVAGVNLGMVLEALEYRETNELEELAALLTESGSNAVVNISDKWNNRRG